MPDLPRVEHQQLVDALRSLGLDSVLVRAAIDLAVSVHRDQKRAGGGPYLEEHIYPITLDVATYLTAHDYDANDAHDPVIIALLHDTIEDSDTVSREAIEESFGAGVAAGVATLSNLSKGDPQAAQAYHDGLRVAPFPVRAIKVFDRLNNLAGLHLRKPEEQRKYLRETREHYLDLAASVDPELSARMRGLVDRFE